jgi:predicted RNA-binding protein YlqC (UPF0109 family)
MNERTALEPHSNLVRKFITGICYRPEFFSLKAAILSQTQTTFFCRVHSDDFGIVIGNKACVIRAIQKIMLAIGGKIGKKFHVVVDKFGEGIGRAPLYKSKDSWDKNPEAIELIQTSLWMTGYKCEAWVDDFSDQSLVTVNTDAPEDLLEAMRIVMNAWGKSQGRRIEVVRTEKVKEA